MLLLFLREKRLGINMVCVDLCMTTCGRCGVAFVYWLGSSRGSDCLVASALPYQHLHTFYVASFLSMYYDDRNGESVWKWQLANAAEDFEKKGSGES